MVTYNAYTSESEAIEAISFQKGKLLHLLSKKNKLLLKATLANTCHDWSYKRTAMMTPAALSAGDRIFVCWIKTTRLRESKPSPAGEMKDA
jgi:hypothetical protein